MHASTRLSALTRPALRCLIALGLMIAGATAHAHPVQVGSHLVDIPAPGQLVEVTSDDPKTDMMLKSMGMDPDHAVLLFANRDWMDAKPGHPPAISRMVAVQVMPGDALPDEVFDKSSPMGGMMEALVVSKIKKGLLGDDTHGAMEVNDHGVYRQVPWGIFFSFDLHTRDPLAKHPKSIATSLAVLKINHKMLMLLAFSLDRDTTGDDSQWTQQTLSDWADAIHQGADGFGTHGSLIYKAAPWIILAILALLAYLLFFKKARPT